MHNDTTHSVLNKLITLTSERDVLAFEQSLAETLYELLGTSNVESIQSVTIYHPDNIRKFLLPAILAGKSANQTNASASFNKDLICCFKTGEYCEHQSGHAFPIRLYPIRGTKDNTVAIVAIETSIYDEHLHEVITLLLKVYQNFIGLLNDNERDTLTGLLNRKTFEHKVNKIIDQLQSSKSQSDVKSDSVHFLAIFDIDHFKRVNDEFGHQIGDEVLLLFSQLMTKTFRSSDPVFRFGGEEFVAVFECASRTDITNVLNRFKEKVASFNFPQVGKVTVSSGYTEIAEYDLSTQLIDRADLALYFAKNNGRNRACFYEQLIAEGALQENKKEGDIELF